MALCILKKCFYYWHFCVRSHILEVLWRISLKLGIYMDKRMMHGKWHCTPSVNNRVMALCIIVCSSVRFAPILKQNICCRGYQFYEFACLFLYSAHLRHFFHTVCIEQKKTENENGIFVHTYKTVHIAMFFNSKTFKCILLIFSFNFI